MYTFNVTITKEEYKETMCKKIVFEQSDQTSTVANTLWIAEGQGYAVRKHYYQCDMYDELLEVDVALDEGSGLWFPTAWHYEQKRTDGNKRHSVDGGTITNIVLNKPIPDGIFEIKNIEPIQAGAPVTWRAELVPPPYGARTGELIWDGNDIVTRGMFAEGLVAKAAAENKGKRFKMMILVNVACISLIIALFLMRYYRHLQRQN